MNIDEFRAKYKDYMVVSKNVALAECDKVNSILVDDRAQVIFYSRHNAYSLLLESSVNTLKRQGITI